jgi:transposase
VTDVICGVDVSSEALDARVGRNGAWQRFARTSEGIDELVNFCRSHGVELVIMEATGG